jgi:hypothetical protein
MRVDALLRARLVHSGVNLFLSSPGEPAFDPVAVLNIEFFNDALALT